MVICSYLLIYIPKLTCLGRYARDVDHLAVRNFAQGAPLGGGSTLKPPRNHGQKPSRTMYRVI